MDRKVSVPVYGDSSFWDKHLAKKSKLIKDKDFKDKVKKGERLDRTLVYERQNYTKTAENNAFRTRNIGQATKTAYETDATIASKSSPKSVMTRRNSLASRKQSLESPNDIFNKKKGTMVNMMKTGLDDEKKSRNKRANSSYFID